MGDSGSFRSYGCDLRWRAFARVWLGVTVAVLASLALVSGAAARSVDADPPAMAATEAGPLILNPAINLQPQLPEGTTATIEASPYPFTALPRTTPSKTPPYVVFRVAGINGSQFTRPVDVTLTAGPPGSGFGEGAAFPYTDKSGVGTDTVTATLHAGSLTETASTTITWAPPPPCPVGLPSLFRSLGCSAAGRLVATVYNTGACLAAFVAAGKLAKALAAAGTYAGALQAAGGSTSIAHLAVDLRALESSGVTGVGLVKAAADGYSIEKFIKSIWGLVRIALGNHGTGSTISQIARALEKLTGFSACIDLIRTRAGPQSPSPQPGPFQLGTLCENSNVNIDAMNGCPYNDSTAIGGKPFAYTILIENNDDSDSIGDWWDLIDFPATTCQSISLTFGLPDAGAESGDTASIRSSTHRRPHSRPM